MIFKINISFSENYIDFTVRFTNTKLQTKNERNTRRFFFSDYLLKLKLKTKVCVFFRDVYVLYLKYINKHHFETIIIQNTLVSNKVKYILPIPYQL